MLVLSEVDAEDVIVLVTDDDLVDDTDTLIVVLID